MQRLGIRLSACKKLKEPCRHRYFDGPPGLGKTTFATVLPNELGTTIQITSGPALTKPCRPAAVPDQRGETGRSSSSTRSIACCRVVEEFIYPVMEDFRVDIVLGEAASTPARSRCRSNVHADRRHDAQRHAVGPYARSVQHARTPRILHRRRAGPDRDDQRRKLKTTITPDAALEIARRSRGTPRIANARLWWARSYAASEADGEITLPSRRPALKMAEVDTRGSTSRIAAISKRSSTSSTAARPASRRWRRP